MPGSSSATTRPRYHASGARNVVRSSQRTFPTTSFVQLDRYKRLSAVFDWRQFPEPYSWPSPILVDELDAGQLKRLSKHCQGRLTRFRSLTFK